MSASHATHPPAAQRHPFATAVLARDHAALVDMLAADVVLRSAVVRTTFDGRATVAELYASVIESFERLEVVDEFWGEDTYAFFWRGRIEGHDVEGVDRLRLDSSGKVREITVFGRPISGLVGFLSGIGSRFARRQRGDTAATMLKLTARPLAPLFAALEPVTRWLINAPRRNPVA